MVLCDFLSQYPQFPTVIKIPKSSMEEIQHKLHKHFSYLPQNALRKIYKSRCEQLRLLMINGISSDIRWLIEAKVQFCLVLENVHLLRK